MNKVKKKFILYALLALFVLITVLLSVINVINFSMVSADADAITAKIANNHGAFNADPAHDKFTGIRGFDPGRLEGQGPESPELNESTRYFTIAFDKDGNAETVAFRISAVTESEASDWARSLINENTGWTKTTYRYRVFKDGGKTLVTVIDQGRELLPSYRILIISVCGEVIGLLISYLILSFVGRKLFEPLQQADRKQRRFIAEAESEFKIPLTVIDANTEIIERSSGASEQTAAIRRQLRKMSDLVKDLGSFAIFDKSDINKSLCDLSSLLAASLDVRKPSFESKNIAVECDIDPNAVIEADTEALKRVIDEIAENASKFAISKASFSLKTENGHTVISQSNDTSLGSGNLEQIFDRFTRLENANGLSGAGLGLSYVKDVVKAHNGRCTAKSENGIFTLKIYL